MSYKPNYNAHKSFSRVAKQTEKFNAPLQTEEEVTDTSENARGERLADFNETNEKKKGQYETVVLPATS